MKIKDLQTGAVHEYGTNSHDSLYVSMDGKTLSYYNLQNGDGSRLGDYRFVCDDEKVPAESETAEARHAEVYFNIGGWHHERPQGEWIKNDDIPIDGYKKCSNCNTEAEWLDGGSQFLSKFCPNCGAYMKGGAK